MSLFFIGFVLALYYVVAGDLDRDYVLLSGIEEAQPLNSIRGCGVFLFQVLLGQHEWDAVEERFDYAYIDADTGGAIRQCNRTSYDDTIDPTHNDTTYDCYSVEFSRDRSTVATGIIILFSIIGTIMLLNLLIAVMTASYQRIHKEAFLVLNHSRIESAFDYTHRG